MSRYLGLLVLRRHMRRQCLNASVLIFASGEARADQAARNINEADMAPVVFQKHFNTGRFGYLSTHTCPLTESKHQKTKLDPQNLQQKYDDSSFGLSQPSARRLVALVFNR